MKNETFNAGEFARIMAIEFGIEESELMNAYDVFASDYRIASKNI